MDFLNLYRRLDNIDEEQFKTIQELKALKPNLVFVKNSETSETIYFKPLICEIENVGVSENEYVCLENNQWVEYGTIEYETTKIKCCMIKTNEIFLASENYGYLQVIYTNGEISFHKVYKRCDIIEDNAEEGITTYFLCFEDGLNKLYYLTPTSKVFTDIENYVVFKFYNSVNQGTININNEKTKICLVSEAITGLNINTHDEIKIVYYNISDLSKVVFQNFNVKNELYIDTDILNIRLDPNENQTTITKRIGKLHFIDDSLDSVYFTDSIVDLDPILSSDCVIVVNKLKNYDITTIKNKLHLGSRDVKEELLNPCFRLHN
jgi:hypothetical protein